MMTLEQKYEHTYNRMIYELGNSEDKVRDIIEKSGLDIDTTDLSNIFDTLKGSIEIMMESS
jgi:hypothetical protein